MEPAGSLGLPGESAVTQVVSHQQSAEARTTFCPHFDLVEAAFGFYSRAINHKPEIGENCMRKAVFASAVAFAMVGSLLVSEQGIGPAPASAQEAVVTEGKIARLRSALRLTGEQIHHWRPVEAALRAAIREQRAESDGWVHKVRTRVSHYAGSAKALQQAYAAAGPLIASLDEQQRQSGRNALRSMGGAAFF
jgi:hypothetical protein